MRIAIRFLLVFMLLFTESSVYAHQRYVDYDLQFFEYSNDPCFHIHLKSEFDRSGKQNLLIPLGGRDFKVKTDAQEIPLEPAKAFHTTQIIGSPHSEYSIEYNHCIKNPYVVPKLPIVEDDFFTVKFVDVLITPIDHSHSKWKISVKTWLPTNFKLASSLFMKDNKIEINKTLYDFKYSMITGGKNLRIKNTNIGGRPITIVSDGHFGGLSKHPEGYVELLTQAHQKFWQDNNTEHLMVTLVGPACENVFSTIEGLYYENAFVMKIPNCKNIPTYESSTKYSLSHELFHGWIGKKIKFVNQKNPIVWFYEGYNDYYGMLFAYTTGLITLDEYIDFYNKFIRLYYISPFKHYSNDQIAEILERDQSIRNLAQTRGHLMAKEQAYLLSQKDRSLDEILRAIYLKSRGSKKPLTNLDLHDMFHQYLDASQWQSFNAIINDGKELEISKDLFGPGVKLVQKELEVPDYGFDYKTFLLTRTIVGLKNNSAAYKAGLREGQKVDFHSLPETNPTEEAIMGWIESNKNREVRFFPEKRKVKIPQYIMK